ncbi:MAG: galactokinase [Treponema sp.]|jgi:galactokinase|nr:galactokinase [Treponema sp.]
MMRGKSLLNGIASSEGKNRLVPLYGNEGVEEAAGRYAGLVEGMLQFAGTPARGPVGFSRDTPVRDFPETAGDLRLFTAPGRTELGGNHTDHNQGNVLAASIQLDQAAVAAPRKDGIVVFRSTGYPDAVVNLHDGLEPVGAETGTTEALIRGIAAEFIRRGTAVRGFTANAASLVLSGSGLSSSAAVEVLIGRIFDNLYGGGKRSALELAQIGQRAENRFFGKPSGLMDQAACALGGAAAIDFQQADHPRITAVPFDPAAAGYALCIVDTKGSHADLTGDYAGIPHEMKAVARFFGKTVLRELDVETVLAQAGGIRQALGDRALLRSLHFFRENERVDAMLKVLQEMEAPKSAEDNRETQMSRFLALVNESGDSSWELLQNIFAPRNPREQALALALALTREFFDKRDKEGEKGAKGESRGKRTRGACRVHGGGFAGTIQAYIPPGVLPAYRSTMEALFGPGAVTELRIRPIGAVELYL